MDDHIMSMHLLELEEYYFTHIQILTNPQHDPEHNINKYDLSTEVNLIKSRQQQREYRLELSISNTQGYQKYNIPYHINLSMIGYFTIHPDIPQHQWDDFIATNGTMMLYSAARELVLSNTSRSVWGAFLLPTVTFDEFQESWS